MPRKANLTDRALRYRAQAAGPRGKTCWACGSSRFITVDHVDGREENTAPYNLANLCKSCNTAKGFAFKRAGIGRITHQYNAAKRGRGYHGKGARSVGEWGLAWLVLKGKSDAMHMGDALDIIHATPQSRCEELNREVWRLRRERGTDKTGVPF